MHKCVQGGTRAGAFVDCRKCQSRVAILEVQVDEAGSRLREAEATIERVKALVPVAGYVSADELEACLAEK